MGSGRDKKKKAKERKDGPAAGRGAEKTARHTERNEAKEERRAEKRLAGDEDDIDALLAQVQLEEKRLQAVRVEPDAPPPSARVNASFVPYVTPRGSEIILFGGEFSDHATGKVYVYKDLYRFSPDKQRWTRVVAPKGPPPRCAHQAFVYKNFMFVFGGEFSSPNQERFLHYRDLWRLDLSTNEWDQLSLKGGPSARSGHRVIVHKGTALLFGGFYDTGRDVRYYSDLWALDLAELRWTPLGDAGSSPGGAPWPAARSGCQLALAPGTDTVFLYGGYVKDKDDEDEDLEHGRAHNDMWALDAKTYKWERVKKAGMAPGPRCSFALAPHKARAFLFGGVSDNETRRGEDLSSEFFNDLYVFSFATRRWFAAQLRPPKDYKSQQGQEQQLEQGQEEADGGKQPQQQPQEKQAQPQPQQQQQQEKEQQQQGPPPGVRPELAAIVARHAASVASSKAAAAATTTPTADGGGDAAAAQAAQRYHRAATRIQAHFRGHVVRKAYKLYQLGGVVSEILYSPAAYGLDLSARSMPKPRARISPQVAVVGNDLWLLGGVVEVGDVEITLDDLWRLDLQRLDGWQLLRENTVGEEAFKRAAAKAKGVAGGGGGDDSDEWEEASSEEDE